MLRIDGVDLVESVAIAEYLDETRGRGQVYDGTDAGAGVSSTGAPSPFNAHDPDPSRSPNTQPHSTAARKLYPSDARTRAAVRAVVEAINAGAQPKQNLSTLDRVESLLHSHAPHARAAMRRDWAAHWNELGMAAVERPLAVDAGAFCMGDRFSFADCCLVPRGVLGAAVRGGRGAVRDGDAGVRAPGDAAVRAGGARGPAAGRAVVMNILDEMKWGNGI